MKFEIKSRWSGEVKYTCELSASVEHKSYSVQLGFAIKKAIAEKADLRGADLRSANLSNADLINANLSGAYLRGADLRTIRADFYDVLAWSPREVPALIDALKKGRVDGSTYQGKCACLVGTIANARGIGFESLEHDSYRPIERFFMNIKEGDTPETNQASAIALEWAESWLASMQSAFGSKAP